MQGRRHPRVLLAVFTPAYPHLEVFAQRHFLDSHPLRHHPLWLDESDFRLNHYSFEARNLEQQQQQQQQQQQGQSLRHFPEDGDDDSHMSGTVSSGGGVHSSLLSSPFGQHDPWHKRSGGAAAPVLPQRLIEKYLDLSAKQRSAVMQQQQQQQWQQRGHPSSTLHDDNNASGDGDDDRIVELLRINPLAHHPQRSPFAKKVSSPSFSPSSSSSSLRSADASAAAQQRQGGAPRGTLNTASSGKEASSHRRGGTQGTRAAAAGGVRADNPGARRRATQKGVNPFGPPPNRGSASPSRDTSSFSLLLEGPQQQGENAPRAAPPLPPAAAPAVFAASPLSTRYEVPICRMTTIRHYSFYNLDQMYLQSAATAYMPDPADIYSALAGGGGGGGSAMPYMAAQAAPGSAAAGGLSLMPPPPSASLSSAAGGGGLGGVMSSDAVSVANHTLELYAPAQRELRLLLPNTNYIGGGGGGGGPVFFSGPAGHSVRGGGGGASGSGYSGNGGGGAPALSIRSRRPLPSSTQPYFARATRLRQFRSQWWGTPAQWEALGAVPVPLQAPILIPMLTTSRLVHVSLLRDPQALLANSYISARTGLLRVLPPPPPLSDGSGDGSTSIFFGGTGGGQNKYADHHLHPNPQQQQQQQRQQGLYSISPPNAGLFSRNDTFDIFSQILRDEMKEHRRSIPLYFSTRLIRMLRLTLRRDSVGVIIPNMRSTNNSNNNNSMSSNPGAANGASSLLPEDPSQPSFPHSHYGNNSDSLYDSSSTSSSSAAAAAAIAAPPPQIRFYYHISQVYFPDNFVLPAAALSAEFAAPHGQALHGLTGARLPFPELSLPHLRASHHTDVVAVISYTPESGDAGGAAAAATGDGKSAKTGAGGAAAGDPTPPQHGKRGANKQETVDSAEAATEATHSEGTEDENAGDAAAATMKLLHISSGKKRGGKKKKKGKGKTASAKKGKVDKKPLGISPNAFKGLDTDSSTTRNKSDNSSKTSDTSNDDGGAEDNTTPTKATTAADDLAAFVARKRFPTETLGRSLWFLAEEVLNLDGIVDVNAAPVRCEVHADRYFYLESFLEEHSQNAGCDSDNPTSSIIGNVGYPLQQRVGGGRTGGSGYGGDSNGNAIADNTAYADAINYAGDHSSQTPVCHDPSRAAWSVDGGAANLESAAYRRLSTGGFRDGTSTAEGEGEGWGGGSGGGGSGGADYHHTRGPLRSRSAAMTPDMVNAMLPPFVLFNVECLEDVAEGLKAVNAPWEALKLPPINTGYSADTGASYYGAGAGQILPSVGGMPIVLD